MRIDAIWQDPNTSEALCYNKQKNMLINKAKNLEYPMDEDEIIDFMKQQEVYDGKATSNIARRLKNGFSSDFKIRSSYLDYLEIWPSEYVLEVHCGDGANIKYLPTSSQYLGIEPSMEQLHKAVKTRKEHELPLTLCHGIAEALPFQDDTFICTFYDGDHSAICDLNKAIQEMVRVTKPTGKFIFITKDKNEKEIAAMLPETMRDVQVHEVRKGKYMVVTAYKK